MSGGKNAKSNDNQWEVTGQHVDTNNDSAGVNEDIDALMGNLKQAGGAKKAKKAKGKKKKSTKSKKKSSSKKTKKTKSKAKKATKSKKSTKSTKAKKAKKAQQGGKKGTKKTKKTKKTKSASKKATKKTKKTKSKGKKAQRGGKKGSYFEKLGKVRAFIKSKSMKVNTGPPLASVMKEHDNDPEKVIAYIKSNESKFKSDIEKAAKAISVKRKKK